MAERDPKFYNKDGSLTVYSFACGYMETFNLDDENRLSLSLDGLWHIKGFVGGKHVWESLDTGKLKQARKRFAELKRVARQGKEYIPQVF